jgi:hypothetical protein
LFLSGGVLHSLVLFLAVLLRSAESLPLLLTITASVSGVEDNNAVVDVTDFYSVKTVNCNVQKHSNREVGSYVHQFTLTQRTTNI